MENGDDKRKITVRVVSGNEPRMKRIKELFVWLIEMLEAARATTDDSLSALSSVLAYILAETDLPIDSIKKEIANLNFTMIEGVEALRRDLGKNI
jgi:hypothetical protein